LFVADELEIPPATLGLARVIDPRVVHHMFRGLTNLSGGLKLQYVCMDPSIMQVADKARAGEVGNRAAVFSAPLRIINAPGEADWLACIYEVGFDENDDAVHCIHRPTGDRALIKEEYGVTKEWEIKNPLCDDSAQLYFVEVRKLSIKQLFSPKTGPPKVPQLKGDSEHWKSLVNAAVAASNKASKVLEQQVQAKKEFTSPGKQAKSPSFKQARVALAAKGEGQ